MATRRQRHAIHTRRLARMASRPTLDDLILTAWLDGGPRAVAEWFECPCCAYRWAPVTEDEWRSELALAMTHGHLSESRW